MLRIQSLISLLEKHGFLRKSFGGFKNDYPELFEKIKTVYEEVEAYQLLEQMVNNPENCDQKYMIWVKNGDLPHILEIKELYSQAETNVFSQKTKIPLAEFTEIILATA